MRVGEGDGVVEEKEGVAEGGGGGDSSGFVPTYLQAVLVGVPCVDGSV